MLDAFVYTEVEFSNTQWATWLEKTLLYVSNNLNMYMSVAACSGNNTSPQQSSSCRQFQLTSYLSVFGIRQGSTLIRMRCRLKVSEEKHFLAVFCTIADAFFAQVLSYFTYAAK